MENRIFRAFAIVCICLAASCGREQSADAPISDNTTVTVTLEASYDDLSKAHTGNAEDGRLPFVWDENDVIAVYDGYKIREFHVVPGSVHGHSASFTGEIWSAATTLSAMYPFSAVKSYSSGNFIYTVSAAQTADDFNCDPAALVASATASLGESLKFSNRTALIGIPVDNGVKRITLHAKDGASLGPDLQSIHMETSGREDTYFIAMRSASLSGLMVFVTYEDGKSYLAETDKTISLTEGKALRISNISKDNPVTLIYDEPTLNSFLSASTPATGGKAFVSEDIQVSGTLACATGYAGCFDGLGHKISGLAASHPLFMTNSGTIRALILDHSCSFTPSDAVFGTFVGDNSGTLESLVNKAPVTVSATSVHNRLVAGVVGKSSGRLINCENEGAVKVSAASFITAAGVAGIAGYLSAAAEGCVNKGVVSLDALNIKEKGVIADVTAALPCVGGVVAYGAPGFTLNGCDNYGAVHFGLSAAETDLTASLNRTQVGGVVGGPCGDVRKCCNYAAVDVNVHHSTPGTALPKELIVQAGGIGGGDYNFTSSSGTFINTGYSDCVNKGDITFYTDASASNSVVGGIVGWPGQEKAHSKATENCTNYGNVVLNGAGKMRAGGIQGGTGVLRNCLNYGKIEAGNVASTSVMGGICGFHSQGHAIEGCENCGDVIANVRIDGAGGLIGNQGNAAMTNGVGCKVKCTVQNAAADRTGMVVGYFNGTSNAITLGSQTSPIGVEGSIVIGSTGVAITKYNVETYKCGSANDSNHTVYVSYTGPDVPVGDFAEGYIKYSDGTPAAGVSVSDGFRVAVTDANGYYRLDTCSDTWYIYFSYPSNAVIKKNAMGTPDFFKRYVAGVSRYDFTLEKCAVEDEFALFALADPQAHYAARSPQKTADTQRFLNESVPAVNSQIAASKIPCYGVTLGDIVYSEGSRNSNAGMNTMASHFGKINMPVFQTMGNHDYTYFYTNSPLTTDATSSTLNLKAQRAFETAFGPINHSFNRGNVHVVCMKNIIYESTTDASSDHYHGGFLNDQYEWLRQDLANVPKSMKVILCVHIPIVSSTDGDNVANVMNLLKQYTASEVFSGHTHYYRYSSSTASSGLKEHIHSAVCGQWWWSKIEGDGCPNGYTVYDIKGTAIKDAYFIGVNDRMNTRDYQMRLYRGNILTGGKYAYFQSPYNYNDLLINVFSGDSRWSVKVYVNGVYAGTAKVMSHKKETFSSVTAGQTYTPSTSSSQDWWAIAYHIGVCKRGTSSTSYYTANYHMFKYTLGSGVSASDRISVEATDPYGNVYTSSDIIEDGLNYPEYIKIPLNL